MDLICEIIDTLSHEERKEFRSFLSRYRNRKERKDEELFAALSKPGKVRREEIIHKLYRGAQNLNAYHATRKRLLRQLMEFIQLKKRRGENVSEGYIENLVSMSGYMFEEAKPEAAWSLLRQAEELALKSESYRILNNIYSIQVEHSQSEHAPDLRQVLDNKKKYQRLALEDDQANTAYHLIRYELNRSLSTGDSIDISKIIKTVLQEYNLTEIAAERPRVMYNIIAITRSAVLAGKEFFRFEPYIIERYKEMESKGVFNKYNHFYKLSLLYMIAHVLYRNKKFKESEEHLGIMHQNMLEYNKSHFVLFFTRYHLLLAAVYNYSGRNKQAIELLEKHMSSGKVRLDKSQELNMYLNLSTYYFQKDEFKRSVRIFQNVQHSDKWLTKIMGFEWVLKKNIIECINQFELGNSDLVEQRLDLIAKNFGAYFQRDQYKRVKPFLALVRKLNDDPSIASSRNFYDLVDSSFDFIDPRQEDIQAMTFYGWLKAKMQKRKYYDVLLELVSQQTYQEQKH